MNTRKKFAILTIILALLSFFLNRVIWPDGPASLFKPDAGLIPFFILLGVLESLAFGVGISLLVWGRRYLKVYDANPTLTQWAFAAIVWSLVSWWPHDNFHRVIGDNWVPLLIIEYIFHVTLIAGAAILTVWFIKEAKTRAKEGAGFP